MAVSCSLIVLAVAACGGGGDNAKTAAPAATQAQSNGGNPSAATTTSGATSTRAGTSSAGGRLDACMLLTNEEVAQAIGPTGEGHLTIDGSTSSCFWEATDTNSGRQVELVVSKGSFDSSILFSGDQVGGIGDEAIWVASFAILDILQGNYNAQVSFTRTAGTSDQDQLNATKALAQKALARLS